MDRKSAIYRFCNYQERSQQEVRDKLYELGSYPVEVEELIADLIESGLLNEERFAKAFVRGKFRMKSWGRVKILQQLKPHRISEYLVKLALKEIDPSEYFNTAIKLAERKWLSLKSEKSVAVRRQKTFRYLLQRGFESTVINEVLQEIDKPE
jgi:regulatory protein